MCSRMNEMEYDLWRGLGFGIQIKLLTDDFLWRRSGLALQLLALIVLQLLIQILRRLLLLFSGKGLLLLLGSQRLVLGVGHREAGSERLLGCFWRRLLLLLVVRVPQLFYFFCFSWSVRGCCCWCYAVGRWWGRSWWHSSTTTTTFDVVFECDLKTLATRRVFFALAILFCSQAPEVKHDSQDQGCSAPPIDRCRTSITSSSGLFYHHYAVETVQMTVK